MAMIGVFDSGFGGLHVLKSVTTRLPEYGYIYLGDSARAPYGPRSPEEIYQYTKEGVDFLFARGATLVILACNTASSEALRKIQMEENEKKSAQGGPASGRKVLGVLIPFAEKAVEVTKNKRVGVMATEGTVLSNSYRREITKLGDIEVFQQACPELVPYIEAGEHDSDRVSFLIYSYLQPLMNEHIDTLVLGCTHYGLIEEKIKAELDGSVRVICEGDVVPPALGGYLSRHPEIEQKIARTGVQEFFTTGDVNHFETLGNIFYGSPIRAQKAQLGI